MRLYVNGNLDNSKTYGGTVDTTTSDLVIGSRAWNDRFFNGNIDEVAIYNRVLSDTEIADHYQRGIMRLKYQVRSCNDSACSGETFIGPDGTSSSYYEWGTTNSTSTPSFNLTNLTNNQYFQYKAYFETDDSSYSPELRSTTINYTGGGGGETTASACLDLSPDLVDDYLPAIPTDPKDGSANKTYYAVKQTSSGNLRVVACNAELGEDIHEPKQLKLY